MIREVLKTLHIRYWQFALNAKLPINCKYEVVIMVNDNSFHVLDIVVRLDQSLEGGLVDNFSHRW